MLLQVDKLKGQSQLISIDEEATSFEVLRELIDQDELTFGQRIRGELTAAWADNIVDVQGLLTTTAIFSCDRCLKPVLKHMEVEIHLCYSSSKAEDKTTPEDIELQDKMLNMVPFSGPEINLRPDIEQDILMTLPQQVLCDLECKGLCPTCGADLNQSHCGCEAPAFHPGLAGLKNFKTDS